MAHYEMVAHPGLRSKRFLIVRVTELASQSIRTVVAECSQEWAARGLLRDLAGAHANDDAAPATAAPPEWRGPYRIPAANEA